VGQGHAQHEPFACCLPAGYPLLDNILVPGAAGTSRISSTFAAALSRSFTLTVKDTFQSSWPAAAALSDTSARVDAKMSDAALLVTYLILPSAQLDLAASPPVMPSLKDVQAGEGKQASGQLLGNAATATVTVHVQDSQQNLTPLWSRTRVMEQRSGARHPAAVLPAAHHATVRSGQAPTMLLIHGFVRQVCIS